MDDLRELRTRRNLTQVQLAEKSGVPQNQISMLETGDRPMSDAVARKLAPVLGVDELMLKNGHSLTRYKAQAERGELDPKKALSTADFLSMSLNDPNLKPEYRRVIIGITLELTDLAAKSLEKRRDELEQLEWAEKG